MRSSHGEIQLRFLLKQKLTQSKKQNGSLERLTLWYYAAVPQLILPEQVPAFARLFNTVDSFDTHARRFPAFFDAVDAVARANGKISVISTGWDPGFIFIESFAGRIDITRGQ